MKSREQKIRRIAAVQARLHRIAEWRLMECQARENELEERQRLIIEGFNDEARLPEYAVQSAGRSLRASSVEQGIVAKTRERLAAHALGEARKLKQALRMAQTAATRAFRDDEKRVLDDEIDKAALRPARDV